MPETEERVDVSGLPTDGERNESKLSAWLRGTDSDVPKTEVRADVSELLTDGKRDKSELLVE